MLFAFLFSTGENKRWRTKKHLFIYLYYDTVPPYNTPYIKLPHIRLLYTRTQLCIQSYLLVGLFYFVLKAFLMYNENVEFLTILFLGIMIK